MEQLTKGEKNILGYYMNTQCSLKLWPLVLCAEIILDELWWV